MQKVKIGFVPSTWESWDGSAYTGKLAGKMRARCLEAFAKIPGLEIVVPSEELTQDGCVGTVEEGMKAADLFNKENVQGLIIGNMNFGFETAIGAMLSKIRKDMPVLHFATCSGPFSPQGYSVGCEVGVMGAITMSIMNSCALGMIPADFIDWTDLHPTEPNVWLAWHCGNAACELCASNGKTHLMMNERLGLWGPYCYGSMEFRMKDGPVTCARMVEYGGKYSIFYGTGESIDIGPMTRGAYAWIRVNDVADWEQKMIEVGCVHHGVLIHDAKVADALAMFCKFMGIEAVRGA